MLTNASALERLAIATLGGRSKSTSEVLVKLTLTPLLTSLTLLNYVEIDSEEEMLGYGIGIILLNVGMYFVAPAVLIISLKKKLQK